MIGLAAAPLPAQFAWRDHRPATVGGLAACLDEARGCFVVLATNSDIPDFETWEWRDTWTRRPLALCPPRRSAACLVYDSLHRRMVLFGGQLTSANGSLVRLADTWEYDGQVWQQRQPAVSPPPRAFAAMAWDSARQQGVLFGGADGANGYADTWIWDGDAWTQRSVQGPSPRGTASMAFDSRRGRIVLFGATSGSASLYETWEWNGSAWTQPSAPWQPVTSGPMAYDPQLQRTLLLDPAGVFEWSGTAWQGRVMSGGTGTGIGMQFDPALGHCVAIRSALDGVHVQVDGGASWAESPPPAQLRPRCGLTMEYCVSTRRTLSFGGSSVSCYAPIPGWTDTWEWDGMAWSARTTPTPPPERVGASMALDLGRQRVVMFGGLVLATGVSGGTWEFDGVDWTLHNVPDPGARQGAAMAYDLYRGVTILFGGSNLRTLGSLADTWSWNGQSWRQIGTPVAPPARAGAAMAFDPAHARIVLQGGEDIQVDDTWTWDGFVWTEQQPAHRPLLRNEHMVTDMQGLRPVLVGNQQSGLAPPLVYTWDGSDWIEQAAFGGGPSQIIGAAYDLLRGNIVAQDFGGATWELGVLGRDVGAGCAGSAGTPALHFAAPARVAGSLLANVSGLAPAATTAVLLLGGDDATSPFGALPLDLTPIGAPGCWLRVDPQLVFVAPAVSGTAAIELPVPNAPQLVGLELFAQALCADAAANAAGAVISNAMHTAIEW